MVINLVKDKIKVGLVFKNPGKGISEIVSISDLGIYYRRGNSKMLIKYHDIEKVYKEFKGKTMSTKDLKEFDPKVFESKNGGHSCNCTVLFLIFKECGLINGDIFGSGKRGNPFHINII